MKHRGQKFAFLATALLLALCCVVAVPVSARADEPTEETVYQDKYVGYSVGADGRQLSRDEIKDATNTFRFEETEDGEKNRVPTGEVVEDAAPKITVLTHGYNSEAKDWSNDFEYRDVPSQKSLNFAYDPDSLIETLRDSAGGATVYRAQMITPQKVSEEIVTKVGDHEVKETVYFNSTSFKLQECHVRSIPKDKNNVDVKKLAYVDEAGETVEKITDITKHIIIVFEAYRSHSSNDFIYAQLDYVIDKIVYDVKHLNGGKLPKINLIGHSRGGLTNMQYALEHPDLVDSIFSMGTPYGGSHLGQSEWILNKLNMSKERGHEYYSEGVDNILNQILYNSYKDRWNNDYEKYYSNIDFYPIGMELTVDSVSAILADDDYSGLNLVEKALINAVIILSERGPNMADTVQDMVNEILGSKDTYKFNGGQIIEDDLFIHLDSALAIEYKGISPYTKCMNRHNVDFEKRAQANTAIPHNLETRDKDIISFILNHIDLGRGEEEILLTVPVEGGEELGVIVHPQLVGDTYTIKPEVNGKTITALGSGLFAGGSMGQNFKHVVIPAAVTSIGNGAFENCVSLERVTFEEGSKLETIGEAAFQNCTALKSIALPASVQKIGAYAFYGSGLTTVSLGDVGEIGEAAFGGCAGLTSLDVGYSNPNYRAVGGVLYNKQRTVLLTYPGGRTAESFTAPATVTAVAPLSFAGNAHLRRVDLGKTTIVQDKAFSGCENLAEVTAGSVEWASPDAFSGTSWLVGQSGDFVSVGAALLSYRGSEASVDLTSYKTISPVAFTENERLTEVTLGGENLSVGSYAFFGCENLAAVHVRGLDRLISIGDMTFDRNADGRTIYLPQPLAAEYAQNELWAKYGSDLKVAEITVRFDSGGFGEFPDAVVGYGSYLDSLPVPQRDHYTFAGWYETGFDGEPVTTATRWLSPESEVTLFAKWIPIDYLISYRACGGAFEEETAHYYNVEQAVTFRIPTRGGYTFAGWYFDEALTQPAGTGFSAGRAGELTLFAKWTPNVYHVTLAAGDDAADPAVLPRDGADVTFGEPFTLPVPTRQGYVFNGYKNVDGELVTDGTGASVRPYGIAGDVALTADWSRKTFYVRVDANGTIRWLGTDGFTDTASAIPYGTVFTSAAELEEAFNAAKISLKEGHKFLYFTLPGSETRFGFWDKLPDLGADGSTFEIAAHFTPEINFNIAFEGETVTENNPLTAAFGQPIVLPRPERPGKTFIGWVVSETPSNNRYLGTALAPGAAFDFTLMPDLSPGAEEDGATIRLAAAYEANLYRVSFSTRFGSVPAPTEVYFESDATLPIVSGLVGRKFLGWYTEADGNGNRITGEDGRLLGVWSIPADTTLYACLAEITYAIEYRLNGGSLVGAYPTTYTVTTETITLPQPGQSFSRFAGWYPGPDFAGERLYVLPKGSTGNKIYYARWEALYTLTFDEGETHSALLAYGESIMLPAVTRDYYDGVWVGRAVSSGVTFDNLEFGSSFTLTVRSDIRFSVRWTGKRYLIHYEYKYSSVPKENLHRYGENTLLSDPYVYDGETMSIFKGFYSDPDFLNKITYISASVHDEITLYLKWEKWEVTSLRNEAVTITDSGRFKQPYDDIIGYLYVVPAVNDFAFARIEITLTVWEKNDGYQYIFLYDGDSKSANLLWELEFEHYRGQQSGTKKTYTFSTVIPLDQVKDKEYLYIRYGAAGSGSDTWYNEDVEINLYLTHD